MQVKLIQYTPEPERTVAMAARLCYSPVGAAQLAEELSREQVQRLVGKILELGHLSTLEHVSFTFAVEGVSRVLSHQLVRHRIASYSQQSQRYVSEHDFEAVVPPSIAADKQAQARFAAVMSQIRAAYDELVDLGIPKEDARYVLANATETKVVVTMNARALLHFFALRCCTRAQWEIRRLAEDMLQEARRVAPLLFAQAGPSCVSAGYCSEGEMSCGRALPLRRQDRKEGQP